MDSDNNAMRMIITKGMISVFYGIGAVFGPFYTEILQFVLFTLTNVTYIFIKFDICIGVCQ